ncbi:MAG: FAD-dependent monooxygenase, partial [Lapillicoccus sp.]
MKALVVGGGVAGPATAMALQRVGIGATVLEAHPDSRGDVGSYFTVSPNGLHALDVLGCLDLAKGEGFSTRRNIMVGASGRELGTQSLGRPLADGTVAITLKRPRMAAILSTEARHRGIEVRGGTRVVSVASAADQASVTLDDGTVLHADLVVGADGVHSLVRRAIDPSAPAPRYVGLTNFGGITRGSALVAQLPTEAWHFVFGRHAFFGAHATPAGDVVWFVNEPRVKISLEERTTRSDEQWRRHLAGLAQDDVGPFQELITDGELELSGDNTYDLGHVPNWHRGRLVILGDAAHAPAPSSGQGASMALEDAVVLAASLQGATSVPSALAAFESTRRARVERIVAVGARSSSSKTAGPVGRVFQDAALR